MIWPFRKPHPAEAQASDMANTIQHQLTRLNLAYREKRDGIEVVHVVEFVQPLIATPEEIRIEVDLSSLPRGVDVAALRDPKVLETLTAACRMPVRFEKRQGAGSWYVVELGAERSSIPRLVKFRDMVQPDNAPALIIPIGVGANKRQQWEDLRDLPHLLIAGATKQGKSVLVNAILCQLIRRWSPEKLKLWLVDLKGGMELSFYEDLPHIPKGKFVTNATDLPELLAELQNEMDRRANLMRGKSRDLDDYNQMQPRDQQLPYIVLVVDEIANAMLNKKRVVLDGQKMSVAQASELLIADLAARARATGIHLIVSTQRPSVDVVSGLIKANFPCRIAFATASDVDSRVIIDDSGAHRLSTKGRLLFRRNVDLIEMQAPLVTDENVRDAVKAALAGDHHPEPALSGEALVHAQIGFLLSLAEARAERRFAINELHKLSEGAVSQLRIRELAERLQGEGIIKKQFGPRPRIVCVSAQHWQAKYPPCVLRVACQSDPTPPPPPPALAPAAIGASEILEDEDLPPAIRQFLAGLDEP